MIIARVRRTLIERGLIARRDRVLVACSGGPDSAALLFSLQALAPELGFALEAASIDHGLREGAARDVELARAQAERAHAPFHSLRVHVEPAASLQAAARAARYSALHALAQRIGASRIAVGHTQDDQAETVLMRLLRGSGLPGLSAIAPLREDGVVRPLIDCARARVHAYAAQQGVELANDPSNASAAFTRVRVRAELRAWLEREDPQVIAHLADLADDARASHEALWTIAQQRVAAVLGGSAENGPGCFDLSAWTADPRAIARIALRELLRVRTGQELGRSHIEQLERALKVGGEVWLPGGWIASSTGAGNLLVTLGVAVRTQQ